MKGSLKKMESMMIIYHNKFCDIIVYKMALLSNCIDPFVLIKRNDIGVGYANIQLISNGKFVPQHISQGMSIKFNKHTKLSSIAWLSPDELTFLKNGYFRIQFFMIFAPGSSQIQISLHVNDIPVLGTFGVQTMTTISGEFSARLSINDRIKLVVSSSFMTIMGGTSPEQIMANLTVTEIS